MEIRGDGVIVVWEEGVVRILVIELGGECNRRSRGEEGRKWGR